MTHPGAIATSIRENSRPFAVKKSPLFLRLASAPHCILRAEISLVLLLLSLLAVSTPAQDLSLAGYRAGMQKILNDLDADRLDAAKKSAQSLEHARITADGIAFTADASILSPIQKAKLPADAEAQKARIKALLAALPEAAPSDTAAAPPDLDLLNRLRRDEEVAKPPRDGTIDDGGIAESGFWPTVMEYLGEAIQWIGRKLKKFIDWFENLFPDKPSGFGGSIGPLVKYILIGAVVVGGAILLRALLRNRRFRPVALPGMASAAPPPSKDENPLSRGVSEWEDYAVKLAADGRYREAIRAWFHAVLVMHFRSGTLSYRKGRTNWEYCFALPPELPWRDRVFNLTGAFETEWYGKSQSTQDQAQAYAQAAKEILSKDLKT